MGASMTAMRSTFRWGEMGPQVDTESLQCMDVSTNRKQTGAFLTDATVGEAVVQLE
jgi:hypothetical protein